MRGASIVRDWTVRASLLIVFAVAAGCFHPSPPEGAPCNANNECPSPLGCFGGFCTKSPADGAAIADAPMGIPDSFSVPDADLSCTCSSATKLTCSGSTIDCPLGCVSPPSGARCTQIVPSNGIDVVLATTVSATVDLSGAAIFNTDTGEITGAITRAAGEGVIGNIGFAKQTFQLHQIGVFVISALTIQPTGTLRFKGANAAALLVRHTITIGGEIDASAGCGQTDRGCAGPGGGRGLRSGATEDPCGGGNGAVDPNSTGDGGGGGGGGATIGGAGSTAGSFLGGHPGAACLPATLEPLAGGGGGGGGGLGSLAMGPLGGGGGGGVQITALEGIAISGAITANGNGGERGLPAVLDASAASGGGAGGGILLEAPAIAYTATAILVANGGGGGGAANGTSVGTDGEDGHRDSSPALGGTAAPAPSMPGGAGGANTTLPVSAANTTNTANGGGGGGAAGRIFTRGTVSGGAMVVSPPAGSGPLLTQ